MTTCRFGAAGPSGTKAVQFLAPTARVAFDPATAGKTTNARLDTVVVTGVTYEPVDKATAAGKTLVPLDPTASPRS